MDLNSTLFYKAKFDIEATNENTDLLWKIRFATGLEVSGKNVENPLRILNINGHNLNLVESFHLKMNRCILNLFII